MEQVRLSVGVLSGGRSSRMGQNKALMLVHQKQMIRCVTDALSGFSELIISAEKPGTYEYLGYPVVYDRQTGIGPLEGMACLLGVAKEEFVFICAADMPFIKKELVLYLAQFISDEVDCIVLTDEEHLHPLCAIYRKTVLPVIEELIASGSYRVREIFKKTRTKFVSLSLSCCDKRVVRNINTRNEYKEAVKPHIFCVSGLKNSGKTGLIEKLINEFILAGCSVSVLKTDRHDSFSEQPGSDTDRFQRAGAVATMVLSDTRYLLYKRGQTDRDTQVQLLADMTDANYQIIEGMKDSRYKKLYLLSKGEELSSALSHEGILALIVPEGSALPDVTIPVFDRNEGAAICAFIRQVFEG